MKKYLLVTALCVPFVLSCQKEDSSDDDRSVRLSFVAVSDDLANSKTSLGDNRSIVWSTSDKITAAFADSEGDTSVECTASSVSDDGLTANFSGVVERAPQSDGVIAVYPSSAVSSISWSSNSATFVFPAEQTAVLNSFPDGANIATAMAKYDGENEPVLAFKNVGGLIGFTLDGGDKTIAAVTVSAYGASMAGTVTTTIPSTGIAEITSVSSASNSITLTGPFKNGGKYYINALPGDYTQFVLEFISADGKKAAVSSSTSFSLERNGNVNLGSFTISSWSTYVWSANWLHKWASSDNFGTADYSDCGLSWSARQDYTPVTKAGTDDGGFRAITNGIFSFTPTKAGTLTITGHGGSGSSNAAVSVQLSQDGSTWTDLGKLVSVADGGYRTSLTTDLPAQTTYIQSKAGGQASYYSIKWDQDNALLMDMSWVNAWKTADTDNWSSTAFKGNSWSDGLGIEYDNTTGYTTKPESGYACYIRSLGSDNSVSCIAAAGTWKFTSDFTGTARLTIRGFGSGTAAATSIYYKINDGEWTRPWGTDESDKFRFVGYESSASPVVSEKTTALSVNKNDVISLSGAYAGTMWVSIAFEPVTVE